MVSRPGTSRDPPSLICYILDNRYSEFQAAEEAQGATRLYVLGKPEQQDHNSRKYAPRWDTWISRATYHCDHKPQDYRAGVPPAKAAADPAATGAHPNSSRSSRKHGSSSDSQQQSPAGSASLSSTAAPGSQHPMRQSKVCQLSAQSYWQCCPWTAVLVVSSQLQLQLQGHRCLTVPVLLTAAMRLSSSTPISTVIAVFA